MTKKERSPRSRKTFPRDDKQNQTYLRGTRFPVIERISYEMVSAHRATSSTETSESPNNTTSSPAETPGTSVTSTVIRSMHTAPTTGASAPLTDTFARLERLLMYPSA